MGFRWHGRLLQVFGALLPGLSACASAAPAPSQDYRGAYVTTRSIRDAADVDSPQELIQPAASGVFIRIAWTAIEPGPARFDWSMFDRVAVPAARAGKKLSVGVIAGSYAPAWLGDQAKIPYSSFTISQRRCSVGRFYWPWNAGYQDAYLTMMRALKAHLQQIGAYDNLKIVKVSFIAQHTLELRLPRRAAGDYDGCQLDDATDYWIKAGYRPSLVLGAYRRVIGAMASDIFPDKVLSQATQRGDSFPDIGEDGRRAADGTADIPLLNAIVKACMAEAGRRCAIQNQSLQSVGPLGDRVVAAHRDGAIMGWQTALTKGRSPCQREEDDGPMVRARNVPRIPCTNDLYGRILNRGVQAGATYLELWPEDVRDFAPAVQAAEQRMSGTR